VNNRSDQNTDLSLLERLGDSRYRSHAWSEFIDRYTFLIFDWLRRWDVDPHSMEDVLQETLMRILGNIKSFERRQNGSFRAWLKQLLTVVGNNSQKMLPVSSLIVRRIHCESETGCNFSQKWRKNRCLFFLMNGLRKKS
jgi:hypothetical protein